ncbi:hypothetical protein [Streptomyces antibioticus]
MKKVLAGVLTAAAFLAGAGTAAATVDWSGLPPPEVVGCSIRRG